MSRPSRRPAATAFSPVVNGNGNNNNNNTNNRAVTNNGNNNRPDDRFSSLSSLGGNNNNNDDQQHRQNQQQQNNNNNNNANKLSYNNVASGNINNNASSSSQQQQNLDPAKFSMTVRGNDMSNKLGTITNTVMTQLKGISALRDTFLNDRDGFVSTKFCTLHRQLESLYAEASDILKTMNEEENKTRPVGNNNNTADSQQQQQEEQQGPAGRGTRRPVAVPFSQQQQQQNDNNNGRDVSPPTQYEAATTTSNANSATLELLQRFQQEHQQQSSNNNNNNNQQTASTKPQTKYVRAQALINQAEAQDSTINNTGSSNTSGLPAYGNNNNNNNGGGAAASSSNPNNGQLISAAAESTSLQSDVKGPGRRLNRDEAHQFCIIEFKCHRMKRFPYDGSTTKVQPGRYVICWGDKGEDCGLCVMTGFCDEEGRHSDIKTFKDANVELHKVRIVSDVFILRAASRDEVATLHGSLANLEKNALQRCTEMAIQRGLNMKFTDCEIQFDRQKFTFYFDATSSVDFRDLTRDLHKIFKARIWLENINGNVKNVVPEGALSQADKKIFAARGVQLNFR